MVQLNRIHNKVNRMTGLTLVEVMIGVVVLGIVLAVAVPNFSSLIESNKLTNVSNAMLRGMSLARSEAIKQNTSTLFCHSVNGQTCASVGEAGWSGYLIRAIDDSTPIYAQQFEPGILVYSDANIASSSFDSQSDVIRFTAFGLARSGQSNNALNGELTLCAPSIKDKINSRTLRIYSGGRMQIIEPESNIACGGDEQ